MNTVLLILLCVFEAAFAALAVSRRPDKKGWRLGRLICNCGQLAVFFIMLIAPGIDLGGRFIGLVILLAVRVAAALIGAIIKKNADKPKRPAGAVLSAILSVMLIAIGLAPSYVISGYSGLPVSGSYAVGTASAILTDESRIEEFEPDGSKREVPVYFYYPENAGEGETFPLVIFSHGAFGYNKSNYSTFTELASNGYVVISAEHPYHSLFTKDTAGKTIIVNSDFMNGIMKINSENVSEEEIFELSSQWLKLRVDDINFVIDSVKSAADADGIPEYWHSEQTEDIITALSMTDTNKIGVMGHSLGGAAAVSLGRTRGDISAVVDLDGTMLGEVTGVENGTDIINTEPYTVPLLSFDNEEHHFSSEESRQADIPYANNIVHDNAVCGYRTYIPETGHMNFTDLPLFSPPLAKMLGTGDADAEKCMLKINKITLGFFDKFLKEKGDFSVPDRTEIQ